MCAVQRPFEYSRHHRNAERIDLILFRNAAEFSQSLYTCGCSLPPSSVPVVSNSFDLREGDRPRHAATFGRIGQSTGEYARMVEKLPCFVVVVEAPETHARQ